MTSRKNRKPDPADDGRRKHNRRASMQARFKGTHVEREQVFNPNPPPKARVTCAGCGNDIEGKVSDHKCPTD